MGSPSWAILDFPGPDGEPVRDVFHDPAEVIEANTPAEVRPALERVESLAQSGLTLVGFVAYDAAPGFEPKFEITSGYDGPLVWFAAFVIPSEARDQHFDEVQIPRFARDDTWAADFDADRYRDKVAEIIGGIGRGDYYQVNLTERMTATVSDPLNVYERIRAAQSAPYCAYIETAEMAVMSVSPELFVRRSGGMIETRPMKGTSRRGRWPDEDDDLAEALASSEKERAENVMIVDLIRSDMGRVAIPGTVEVPALFTVERYPTVLQMTSHVRSQLKPGTTLADVFTALFPCGSVTGAPKIAASKCIRSLEPKPRGVYCGAVGVVRPGAREFTFNVAIRTAVVTRETGRAVYGAGGGITADSDPDRELAELRAKAAVLTSVPREIELLETLRLDQGRLTRLDDHLHRLTRSADYFGFGQVERAVSEIRAAASRLADENRDGRHRLRILLRRDGTNTVAISPQPTDTGMRSLRIARTPVDSADRHLFHKLSDRSLYADRMEEADGADDVILVNERGELTETTIGNLVLELNGRRVTPALGCGLLPGVFRATLLTAGEIEEGLLHPDDLRRTSRIWMINSLREWVPCELR
jgi:para-aminobenzoate synthetase / 4-amino-4-deoxychorismate lyase